MPYNLLLLPLLGGFLFIHITHYFRFAAQRLDGYRLLFQTAIAGTLLAVVARVAIVGIEMTAGHYPGHAFWSRFAPFPYSGTSILSLALGLVFALIVNLFIGPDKAKDREIRRHGNLMTQLLHLSARERRLVSITLENRKWYVGWVAESPSLYPQEIYFRLLPLTSGYRKPDTLETVITNSYENVLADPRFPEKELVLTFAVSEIKIANLFNEDVYNDYFAEPVPASEDARPSHHHHA
jgi:hypothetical protein